MRQPLGAVSALAMIGAGYNALVGDYDLAWQVVSWVLIVAVELMGLLAGFALFMQKFGRGRTYALPDTNPAVLPEETFTNGSEAVENNQEATERDGAEPANGKTNAIWFPHPDDPPPTEASPTPKDAEATNGATTGHPRPMLEQDTYDHIRKLAELRDEGLIDPKEFEAKKQDLLNRI
jgi:hypothetical protein